MIKAYKITPEEKELLQGTQMSDGVWYKPIQDINGDWFIFEIEHIECGLGVEAEFVPEQNDDLIM